MKATIVLSPTYSTRDNRVVLVNGKVTCSECGQEIALTDAARKLGHEFVAFLAARAYGTFWDGMLDELRKRGKV